MGDGRWGLGVGSWETGRRGDGDKQSEICGTIEKYSSSIDQKILWQTQLLQQLAIASAST